MSLHPLLALRSRLWQHQSFLYKVWFWCARAVLHNQLANPMFRDEMDYAPKQVYDNNDRVLQNLMSGDWVWDQAVCSNKILVCR